MLCSAALRCVVLCCAVLQVESFMVAMSDKTLKRLTEGK